jgi:hypothetical protein
VDYQHGFRNVFERPKDDLFVTLGVSAFAF